MSNRKFVFIICGKKDHIETLNQSLRFLRYFSQKEIIVITDKKRNESEILHDNIINVVSPVHFTNKQASRWLKTGLWQWLDMSHTYCYLDSDIIAVSEEMDSIFDYRQGVIQFVQDVTSIGDCGGYLVYENETKELRKKEDEFRKFFNQKTKSRLSSLRNWLKRKLSNGVKTSRGQGSSPRKPGKRFFIENIGKSHLLSKGYFFDSRTGYWKNYKGDKLYAPTSTILIERIKETFGVEVSNPNWKMWNGGLFLFDKKSEDFLKNWHEWTIQIFENPNWQDRDMGTLAATIWKYEIENESNLPSKFNYLLYPNAFHKYKGNLEFSEGDALGLHFINDLKNAPKRIQSDVNQLEEKLIKI